MTPPSKSGVQMEPDKKMPNAAVGPTSEILEKKDDVGETVAVQVPVAIVEDAKMAITALQEALQKSGEEEEVEEDMNSPDVLAAEITGMRKSIA